VRLVLPLVLAASCASSDPASTPPPPAPSASARAQPAPKYRVVDATPAFWAFWNKHAGDSIEEKRAAFQREVIASNHDLFAPGVVGVDPTKKGSDLDRRLLVWLADLPSRIATMRRLSEQASKELARHDESFRALFPDMTWSGRVVFTVSIDAFDGAVRKVGDQPALLFGIDKIAKLHGERASLAPLFHHELFHVHHETKNPTPVEPEEGPHGLLQPIYREGMAVYVSKLLHPRATNDDLLLSDAMVRDGTARLPRLAAELRALLDDATEADYRDFFLGRGQRGDVPVRVAYWIGLRVMEELAKTRTLEDLVVLRGPALRSAVDGALASFAKDTKLGARCGSSRCSPSGVCCELAKHGGDTGCYDDQTACAAEIKRLTCKAPRDCAGKAACVVGSLGMGKGCTGEKCCGATECVNGCATNADCPSCRPLCSKGKGEATGVCRNPKGAM